MNASRHIKKALPAAAFLLTATATLADDNAPDSIQPASTNETVAASIDDGTAATGDTLVIDSLLLASADSAAMADLAAIKDSVKKKKPQRDWATWRPNPKKALWLAIVIPGAGQIYNRKYWKLPIFYGGFLGCIYAMRWNNQMYHDYSQAYMDLVDDNDETDSYNEFLHLGTTIDEDNQDAYENLFKKRKDRYRKWRDLSVFVLIAVYALSVIDAYVDASLSDFDISEDLSLRLEPTVINNKSGRNPVKSSSLGVQCSLNF